MTTHDKEDGIVHDDEAVVKRYRVEFFDDSSLTVTAARVAYGNGYVEFYDQYDRRLGRFDLGKPAGVFTITNLGRVTA